MNKRRLFFLTYLTTALVASVLVFFAAPLVRGSIPNERFDRMARACRSDAPLSGVLAALVSFRSTPAPEPDFDRPPGPQPRISRSRPTPDTRATRGTVPFQTTSIPDQAPVENNANPPTAPVYDYTAFWAVVTNDTAAVYDNTGNLTQELGPGSLIEVAAVKTNQSERLAICRYDTKPQNMEIAFIRTRDLMIRKGSLDSANADLLALLRKQIMLETEIRGLRASLAQDLARQNPHTESYTSSRSALIAFNETAKTLNAKRDGSQGAARMEIMDQLRSMKEEGAQLRRKYDAAKSAFETWNDAHSAGDRESEPVKALQQELADVRRQIGRLDTN